MRINLFFPYLPPYPSAGSLRAVSIIEGLVAENRERKSQHRLVVYTATKDAAPIEGVELVSLSATLPSNTASFARRVVGEIAVGLLATAKILFGTGKRDAILASSPVFIPAVILGVCASLLKRRYILDIRDLYPLVYADAGLLSSKSFIFRSLESLEQYWLAKAQLIFAATQGLARHVAETGTEASIVSAYNGFPARIAHLEAPKRERFTACFHGILGQFQDIDGVIEIARQLTADNIDVVVIGYGSKADLLENANLPNLHFLGRLPFDETIRAVATCHIGLCLRRDGKISRDAFPVKTWECLGLGIPSVVTPPCEAGEFLDKHQAGTQFPTGDIKAIVSWIRSMRSNPVQYEFYAANCRKLRSSYTREHLGNMMGEAILDILERGSLRRVSTEGT